jgi:long-chain acyl-CoA synthetase
MRAEKHVAVSAEQNAQSLVELLLLRALNSKQTAALHKQDGVWTPVSWGEVLSRVKRASDGLVGAGVKPGDRVAIFAATTLEWVICDLAVSASRAITVPIYASNTPDETRYILNHSEASVLLVDDDEPEGKQAGRLSRVRQRIGECPTVKTVVLFRGQPQGPRERTLADLLKGGEAQPRRTIPAASSTPRGPRETRRASS